MKKVLLFLLIFVTSSPFVFANWQPSSGPYGGIIQSLAYSENVVVAGCHGNESGVFISENKGATWKKVVIFDGTVVPSPEIMVKNIVKKEMEDIFFIAAENGIYKLFKADNDWEIQTIGFKNTQITITDITYTNNTLFVSFWGSGVRKSIDEGISWNTANVGLNELNASALAHSGDTIYSGTEDGLYVSYDLGQQWSFFDANLTDQYIVKIFIDDKNICLAEFRAGALVYNKNGTLLTRADPVGEYETSVIPFSLVDGKLYGQYQNASLYSTNTNLISWEKISDQFDHNKPLSLIKVDSELLVGTNGFGVFRSSNQGMSWIESSMGIKAYAVNALESQGNKLYMATSVSGFFISDDQGFSWKRASSDFSGNTFNDILIKEDRIFLAGYGLYISTDQGKTFTQQDPRYFTDLTANNNTIFAASLYEGLIYSDNNGDIWQEMNFDYESNPIYSIEAHDSIVVIGAHYDSPFLSTDNGKTWTSTQQNLSGHAVRSIAFKESLLFITTGCGAGECIQPTGVYRSADLGNSWQYKNNNLGYELVSIEVNHGILFGYAADNLFYSLNNGNSWEMLNNQIISENGRIQADSEKVDKISSFAATTQYLYLGTNNGMFYRDNTLEAITALSETASPRNLMQTSIYPNPFYGRARLEYTLARDEPHLHLTIYDSQGKLVQSKYIDENRKGEHSLELFTDGWQNGIYTYRLHRSTGINSGKFVLMDP